MNRHSLSLQKTEERYNNFVSALQTAANELGWEPFFYPKKIERFKFYFYFGTDFYVLAFSTIIHQLDDYGVVRLYRLPFTFERDLLPSFIQYRAFAW